MTMLPTLRVNSSRPPLEEAANISAPAEKSRPAATKVAALRHEWVLRESALGFSRRFRLAQHS